MRKADFVLMMADVLEAEASEIRPEVSLFDFPTYDSVCALTLMARLEDDAKVECSPDELAELKTIADVAALIARHVGLEE